MTPDLTAQIADILVPAAGTLVTALVSWIVAEVARYVRARTKNEAVANAMERIGHTVATTVAEIEQRVVPQVRAGLADGRLDKVEKMKLKALARHTVLARLAPQVRKEAAKAVGNLDRFVNAKIEQAVLDLRRSRGAC